MKKVRRYISILNNFISGIGIITLGIIVTIGSINLYTKFVNLLVYAFIIFGLSNLISFIINRRIVRNAQTLFLIIINIVLGIVMLIFPAFSLSLLPIFFSIYLLLYAIVKFINYTILKEVKLKSRFKYLISSMLFLIGSLVFISYPLERLNIFIMFIGIYSIILGLKIVNEFILDVLSKKTRFKIRKKFKTTFPIFLEAFMPQRSLKKINKYFDKYMLEDEKNYVETDLKIMLHLSTYGVNQFGHIDIIIDDNIYSYGNYDRSTRRLFNGLGDGVLFITKNKKKYIDFCLNHNRETIVEYGIKITDKQKEKIIKNLDRILSDTYEWKPPIVEDKNIKKLYYADKMYKAIKCKYYKFKSNEFKTFFIVGVNCTYLVNLLLTNNVFQKLKLVGVISPGTYYEYLEDVYKKKDSNVVYRKIYNKGDISDKDKK